jgi:Domain of unknown function (DUF4351)
MGNVPIYAETRVKALSLVQLEDLGETWFDFTQTVLCL